MQDHPPRRRLLTATVSAAIGLLSAVPSSPALAQVTQHTEQTFNIDLPSQPLGAALTALSAQTGVQIYAASELVSNLKAPSISGRMSAYEALRRLLTGSNLTAQPNASGSMTIHPRNTRDRESILPPVTVQAAVEQESAWGPVAGYSARRSATATKTDTPIIETPQSISVVTSDFIESIGATRLTDALAYTPGIRPVDGLDTRYDALNLRGFDSTAPGYYLDGLQLRNNASYSPWRIETYGLERVEVLRGPSSVLYGQNTPGGTINAVSKRPAADTLREIQIQAGNHSRLQFGGDFSGPLTEDGTVLYRVTGFTLDSKTQVDHMPDDRTFIAPSLTIRPSSDTTLTFLSHYERIRAKGSYIALPTAGTLLSNPNGSISTSTFTGEPDFNKFHQDQWAFGYALEHRFNDILTLRQNTRYGRIDVDYWDLNNGSFITVDSSNPANPANYRQIRRYIFGAQEKSILFNMDNHLQAKLNSGNWQHTILFGLDYQRSRYDQTLYWGSAPSLDIYSPIYGQSLTIPAPNADADTTLLQTGLYLQDQIKFENRWAFTVGGRYDRAKVNSKNHLDGSTSKQTDERFSGRAGLVYLSPSGFAPYLSYSESFSPVTTINPDSGKPFDPETGRQYEIGLRYKPDGHRDSYSIAAFDLRRQNYITLDSSYTPRQTGEITVRGLELEAITTPLPNLNLVAAYTYTPKADVTKSSRPGEVGKQMQAVPRNQLSIWADYMLAPGMKVGLGARYTGSTRGYGEQAPKKVPSYTLFDALVSYDFGPWLLSFNARNLTDKKYLGGNCSETTCSYGERRQLLATATYRW